MKATAMSCEDFKIREQFMERDEELIEWSICLGFNGELTKKFFTKLQSVKKVRKRITGELIISICTFTISTGIFMAMQNYHYINDYYDITSILLIFVILLSCLSILAHLRVVIQWQSHDREMYEEWMKTQLPD